MARGKQQVPAVEGWFTPGPRPHLVGTRCTACGTYAFPPERTFCRNPHCPGGELEEVPLSRTGRLWSWTVNHYPAPPPYVAPDPFRPYAVAAVELEAERMVVLGQVDGDPAGLELGRAMELVVGPLLEDEQREYLVWKWRPA